MILFAVVFMLLLLVVVVHHVDSLRTGNSVRVVETLGESGVVMASVVHALLESRIAVAACDRGRYLHRWPGHDTVLHAQLEEDILERSEAVCCQ